MIKCKRLLSALLIVLLMAVAVSGTVRAEASTVASGTSGNIKWVLDDSGCLTLTGSGAMKDYANGTAPWDAYSGQIRTVLIGDGITSVGAYAFFRYKMISSITLPEGITSIGKYAFYGCERWADVRLPSTLKTIGEYAFAYCYSIADITFPEGLESLGSSAFTMCGSLEEIVLPDSVTSLGSSCFAQCDDLDRVVLSDGLTALESSAFFDSDDLKEVVMPRNLKTLDSTVFCSCDSLESITIPASVTSLEGGSLAACTSMTAIHVEEGNTAYKSVDGVLFSADGKTLYCYPAGRADDYAIPDGTVTIARNAFTECNGLTALTFPDSLTTLEDYAISRCDALVELDLNRVQTVGEHGLEGCTGLKRVFFGDALTTLNARIFFRAINVSVNVDQIFFHGDAPAFLSDSYGNGPFCGTTGHGGTAISAYTIYYPDGNATWDEVVSSGNLYGANENGITWVPYDPGAAAAGGTFGDGLGWTLDENGVLTVTGTGAMPDVSGVAPWYDVSTRVRKVVISDGITSIGAHSFYECFNLTEIAIPESVTAIGSYAFYGCQSLTGAALPDGIRSLGEAAFCKSGLKEIVLPGSCLDLGQGAFYMCSELAEVTLPENLPGIPENCFASCASLNSIDIPASVTSIGGYAFYASGLTEITIPASVAQIGAYVFSENPHLQNIHVDSGSTALKSEDGVLLSGDGKVLYNYPMARTGAYAIPAGVATIEAGAFRGAKLSEVRFPASVTTLGAGAFRYCHNLTKVDLSDSMVTRIGASAFRECSALKEAVLGDSVGILENYVFYGCNKLERVVFGERVSSIGEYIVTYSNHDRTLKQLTFTGPAPSEVSDKMFYLVYGDVYYPAGDSSWDSVINSQYGSVGVVYHAHTHNYQPVVTAPTCTGQGYTAYECGECGDSYVDENSYTDPVGHSYNWVESVVIKEATCTENGEAYVVCTACGDVHTYVRYAYGHDYEFVSTEPTCTLDGYTTYTCSICGDSYVDTYSDPLSKCFGSALAALGACGYWDYDAEYMLHTVNAQFACLLPDGAYDGEVTVAAAEFEEVLNRYFEMTEEKLEEIRAYRYAGYDAQTQTYNFYVGGGMGGILDLRAYTGYVNRGEHYDVYFAVVNYDYLCDHLPEGVDEWEYAEELGWPDEIEYDGVVFQSGPEGYYAVESYEDYGRMISAEINGAIVRILDCTEYTSEMLPAGFDDRNGKALGHDYVDGVCTRCGARDAETVASGWSGATTWTLTSDGVLTFSGEGNMKNYGWGGGQPWMQYADQITSVVIENGVTAVGTGAFKDLTTLESVTLPDSGLKTIGQAAFYGCTSLKSIYIPDGVYTIWEYTFKNCSSLEYIRLPKTLIKIDQGAFEACTALTELFLPTNVQIIGGWSFKGCTAMKSVDMQWADATTIRPGAFKNCTALTEIVLPADIQVLGDSCFYGIGATSFVVPATVTEVQDWCFARSSVKTITFEGDAPSIGTGAFNKISLTAYYPAGNATWTSAVMQNYGGTVTWEAME